VQRAPSPFTHNAYSLHYDDMQTALLLLGLLIIPGLITVALVSIATRYLENRPLDKLEIVLSLLLWPYFLIALIVHMNSDGDLGR
jgi:hypothetical protein